MNDEDQFSLHGMTAVVTGAAQGLGESIAHGLAARGARLFLADLDGEGVSGTAQDLREGGADAYAFTTDVTDPASIGELFRAIGENTESLDVLVNNAGIGPKSAPETMELAFWDNMLRVNTTSYLLMSQGAFPLLTTGANLGGSIINISSIASMNGLGRGNVAYSVSKAAVNQLTRELAVEWGVLGIRVNAIMPCQFLTPALQKYLDSPAGVGVLDLWLSGIPLGRIGNVDEIVGPVVFLASRASAMVTGHMLAVDGGNLATNASASLRTVDETV